MDFNIIKLDCNYENALIAGKNHDYLWLFSREKFVDFKIKENFLLEASELGFNTKKLTWIRHD
jgi:apolipoprotein D and lipocalin family protein